MPLVQEVHPFVFKSPWNDESYDAEVKVTASLGIHVQHVLHVEKATLV